MYVILIYDIDTEGPGKKVLQNVFKISKKYLHHVQKSVFEGEISASQLFALKSEILGIIRRDLDSVIIFKSREERWLLKEFWTDVEDSTSNLL